jgi:hypothetical protein
MRRSASQSRNDNLSCDDFCARALTSVGDNELPEEPQSCFRIADALQHFFLAFP